MAYKVKPWQPTTLAVNQSFEGETIEDKIDRLFNNQEPITDTAPIIYTDRKDGVQPAYNIRTDRWELAVEAMDAATKAQLAKREERQKQKNNKDGTAEPTQGTEPTK